jgi:hypothetical protein
MGTIHLSNIRYRTVHFCLKKKVCYFGMRFEELVRAEKKGGAVTFPEGAKINNATL